MIDPILKEATMNATGASVLQPSSSIPTTSSQGKPLPLIINYLSN